MPAEITPGGGGAAGLHGRVGIVCILLLVICMVLTTPRRSAAQNESHAVSRGVLTKKLEEQAKDIDNILFNRMRPEEQREMMEDVIEVPEWMPEKPEGVRSDDSLTQLASRQQLGALINAYKDQNPYLPFRNMHRANNRQGPRHKTTWQKRRLRGDSWRAANLLMTYNRLIDDPVLGPKSGKVIDTVKRIVNGVPRLVQRSVAYDIDETRRRKRQRKREARKRKDTAVATMTLRKMKRLLRSANISSSSRSHMMSVKSMKQAQKSLDKYLSAKLASVVPEAIRSNISEFQAKLKDMDNKVMLRHFYCSFAPKYTMKTPRYLLRKHPNMPKTLKLSYGRALNWPQDWPENWAVNWRRTLVLKRRKKRNNLGEGEVVAGSKGGQEEIGASQQHGIDHPHSSSGKNMDDDDNDDNDGYEFDNGRQMRGGNEEDEGQLHRSDRRERSFKFGVDGNMEEEEDDDEDDDEDDEEEDMIVDEEEDDEDADSDATICDKGAEQQEAGGASDYSYDEKDNLEYDDEQGVEEEDEEEVEEEEKDREGEEEDDDDDVEQ